MLLVIYFVLCPHATTVLLNGSLLSCSSTVATVIKMIQQITCFLSVTLLFNHNEKNYIKEQRVWLKHDGMMGQTTGHFLCAIIQAAVCPVVSTDDKWCMPSMAYCSLSHSVTGPHTWGLQWLNDGPKIVLSWSALRWTSYSVMSGDQQNLDRLAGVVA